MRFDWNSRIILFEIRLIVGNSIGNKFYFSSDFIAIRIIKTWDCWMTNLKNFPWRDLDNLKVVAVNKFRSVQRRWIRCESIPEVHWNSQRLRLSRRCSIIEIEPFFFENWDIQISISIQWNESMIKFHSIDLMNNREKKFI